MSTHTDQAWKRLKKRQAIERKTQYLLSICPRFSDVDPRDFLRPLWRKNNIYGFIKALVKKIYNEIHFDFFRLFYARKTSLEGPIFMIGMPHSGTTISMDLFARHSEVINSSELNTYWHPKNYLDLKHAGHVKTEKDCNPRVKSKLRNRLKHELFKRNPAGRFFNKNPNNSVTLRFIHACFPDAYIIHVVRDGRSVVNSLIRGLPHEAETYDRHKPVNERINPFPGVKPENWHNLLDDNPVKQHAKQWEHVLEYIQENKQVFGNKFLEIKYEDLCLMPQKVIANAWEFAGLKVDEDELDKLPQTLENRNYKYKSHISEDEIQEITQIMKPMLQFFDYEQ